MMDKFSSANMNTSEGFIVRFVRKDGKPDEEYLYHTPGEGLYHFELFANDDSGLYTRIEVSRYAEPDKIGLVHLFEGEAACG